MDLVETVLAFRHEQNEAVDRARDSLELLNALRQRSLILALQKELHKLPASVVLQVLERRAAQGRDEGSEETKHDINLVRAVYAIRFMITVITLDRRDAESRDELLQYVERWIVGMTKVTACPLPCPALPCPALCCPVLCAALGCDAAL